MKDSLTYKLIVNAELATFGIAQGKYLLRFQPVDNDTGYWVCEVLHDGYTDDLLIEQVPFEGLFSQFMHVGVNQVRDKEYSKWIDYVDVNIYDLGISIRFFDEFSMFSILSIPTMRFLDSFVSYLRENTFNLEKNRICIYTDKLMYSLCIDLPAKQWKVGEICDLENIPFEEIFNEIAIEKPIVRQVHLVRQMHDNDKLDFVSVEFPNFTLIFNADNTIEFNLK